MSTTIRVRDLTVADLGARIRIQVGGAISEGPLTNITADVALIADRQIMDPEVSFVMGAPSVTLRIGEWQSPSMSVDFRDSDRPGRRVAVLARVTCPVACWVVREILPGFTRAQGPLRLIELAGLRHAPAGARPA